MAVKIFFHCRHTLTVGDGAFNHKIDCLRIFKEMIDLNGHPNCITRSREMAILMNGYFDENVFGGRSKVWCTLLGNTQAPGHCAGSPLPRTRLSHWENNHERDQLCVYFGSRAVCLMLLIVNLTSSLLSKSFFFKYFSSYYCLVELLDDKYIFLYMG